MNIPSIVGGSSAYVGFTGGTGGLTSIPAILNWTYTPGPARSARPNSNRSTTSSPRTSGWYYAEVTASPGTDYSLVATRDADFTLHGNTFANAQPSNGVDVVLGAIVQGRRLSSRSMTSSAFASSEPDLADRSRHRRVHRHHRSRARASRLNNPFGLNLAYDGTYLYYNDGRTSATTRSTSSTRPPARSCTRSRGPNGCYL